MNTIVATKEPVIHPQKNVFNETGRKPQNLRF